MACKAVGNLQLFYTLATVEDLDNRIKIWYGCQDLGSPVQKHPCQRTKKTITLPPPTPPLLSLSNLALFPSPNPPNIHKPKSYHFFCISQLSLINYISKSLIYELFTRSTYLHSRSQ
jgi:hypothetical protein